MAVSYWDEGWTYRNNEGGDEGWGRWSNNDSEYGEWIARPDKPAPQFVPWSQNTLGSEPGGFIGNRSIGQFQHGPNMEGGWDLGVAPGFDPHGYRTNKDQIPELADFYNVWNAKHNAQYGTSYNRPWNKHGESALRDDFLKQYTDAVAEYNQIHGTNLTPDAQAIERFGGSPTEWASTDPSRLNRPGGFFNSGMGQMVLIAASAMGAPYLSAFLGGGLAGSVGTGAVLGGGRAALTGGDIAKGALMGAAGGGLAYGAGLATGGVPDNAAGGAEAWSDWATTGPAWTSGADLPTGTFSGGWGIPDNAAGGAEMWGGADMFAGAGAGGADLSSLDWVSGGDLPTGTFGGAGIPATAVAGGAAAATGGATTASAAGGATGGATGAATTAAGAAVSGLTGNPAVDSVIRGLASSGIPQALIGTVVSNLVADGLFGAGDARDAAERYSNAAAAAIGQNQQITMEQYNRWKQQYAPLEDELIGQARRGLGNEEVDSVMGRINADATQQFGQARENLSEELRRRGIQPGSGAEILGLSELGATEAASKTGAQTTAKEGIRQFNRNFATQIAGMGRGIPGQTMTNLSNQTGQNAQLAATKNQLGMNQQYAAGQATAPFVRAATRWFDDNAFKNRSGIPENPAGGAEMWGGAGMTFGRGGFA